MKPLVVSVVTVLCASFVDQALAGGYSLSNSVVGAGFFDAFIFETIADPSNGTVNYVDRNTAEREGLVSYTENSFTLRADHTTKLSSDGPGRDSFRLRSNQTYSTHVVIFDINHMPSGCGTWPGIRERGDPTAESVGSVDILEGVNSYGTNAVSLHTNPGCTVPPSRNMTGTAGSNDCQGGTGCGVTLKETDSFGPTFNNVGGGWYAMERTLNFIRVWFWDRTAAFVPNDVKNGTSSVNTDDWGTPSADFPNTDCDFAKYFGQNYISIGLDFCGSWAGSASVYAAAGCPGTCDEYVRNNPEEFSTAYFDFAAMRIYQ